MGGPKNLEEIRPFLYKLFSDNDIIKLPFPIKLFQKPIAWLIAKTRTPFTTNMYSLIGNGSPIREITEDLAKKIDQNLASEGINSQSFVCMRYTEPRADIVVDEVIAKEANKIILFSQYPHYAEYTTGSSINDFYKYFNSKNTKEVSIEEIKDWGETDVYIDWWVTQLRDKLQNFEKAPDKDVHIIFSAHGLPLTYIKKGEKYPERVESAVEMITSILFNEGFNFSYHLSFQSQAGPLPWTPPYTLNLIPEIAKQSPRAIIMVPIGFVSDHVETLYEIDILYKNLAEEHGIPNFSRVEVPDADDEYARRISKMLLNYIQKD